MADSPEGAGTRRCCFSDAVGDRVVGCTKAVKGARQYRRTVHCRSGEAHDVCAAWLEQVRRASRFTLGASRLPSALPRHTARKLQCGGLLGIQALLDSHADGRIQDVSALLRKALARYGSFDQVPLGEVVQRVHQYEKDGHD